jgi:serine/threonine protein kinase
MNDLTISSNRFGPYIVQEKLGAGAMAVVYKAIHEEKQSTVALKVLRTSLTEQDEVTERFKQEVTIVNRLRHAHIVPVSDYGVLKSRSYMAMRYMAGGTLAKRFAQPTEIAPQEAVRLMRQIGGALDYAHAQGVVHRDLKLENILLDHRGDASISDFGIARIVDGARLTATGGVIGTPLYIAPEQAMAAEIDYRADLYSLGIIMYLITVGYFPFDGGSVLAILNKHLSEPPPLPSRVNPNLPAALDSVLLKALAKDPADRYASADILVEAFARAITSRPVRNTIVNLTTDASGKPLILEKPLSSTRSADDWYEMAMAARESEKQIDYLKRALELDPLHSKANRALFKIEGATPSSRRAAPQPTPQISEKDLSSLKKARPEQKTAGIWTYVGCSGAILLGISASFVLVLLLDPAIQQQIQVAINAPPSFNQLIIPIMGIIIFVLIAMFLVRAIWQAFKSS